MDVLMSLQQSQLDADDPTASYMLQVWSFYKHQLGNIYLFCRLVKILTNLKFSLGCHAFRHGHGFASALGRIFSHIWVLWCLLCSSLHNLSPMWPLHQRILILNLMKMMTGALSVIVTEFDVIVIIDWYPWHDMI